MSIRVRLLFNFPQYKAIALSIVTISVGACSIGATVFGHWVRIWGHYVYPGAWGGGVCILVGALGLLASHYKGVCSVKSFMSMSYLGCLASVVQLMLSVGGLIPDSNFYANSENYRKDGTTKLIFGLLTGFSFFQSILCLVCAVICTKLVCCFTPDHQRNGYPNGKNKFSRGTARASTSSHKSLVHREGGSHNSKHHNVDHNTGTQPEDVPDPNRRTKPPTQTSQLKAKPIIRGRRYGNVPVVGSNVVELMERHDQLRLLTDRPAEGYHQQRVESPRKQSNRSSRESHHRQRRGGHSSRDERQNRENERLLESLNSSCTGRDFDFMYADGVESPGMEMSFICQLQDNTVPKAASFSQRDFSSNDFSTARTFIPIEKAVEPPLSIEDDELLPPYEETVKTNGNISQVKVDVQNQSPARDTTAADARRGPQEALFYDEVRHRSFSGRQTYMERPVVTNNTSQNFKSSNNVISDYGSSVSPVLARKLLHDPQGVSYCPFKRNEDQIRSNKLPVSRIGRGQRNADSENNGESSDQSSLDLPHTGVDDKYMGHSYDSDLFLRKDPRRISVASTMSLPAGFPPPKPPRLFHVDYTSPKKLNNKSSLDILTSPASVDNVVDPPRSVDKTTERSLSLKGTEKRGIETSERISTKDRKQTGKESDCHTVFKFDQDAMKPLSIETNMKDGSVPTSVPYAHSTPKLKGWEEITLHHKSPGISPIPKGDQDKSADTAKGDKTLDNSKAPKDKSEKMVRDTMSLSLRPYLTCPSDVRGEDTGIWTARRSNPSALLTSSIADNNEESVANSDVHYKDRKSRTPERSKSFPRTKGKPPYSIDGLRSKGQGRSAIPILERKLPLPSSFMSSSMSPVLSIWKGSEKFDSNVDVTVEADGPTRTSSDNLAVSTGNERQILATTSNKERPVAEVVKESSDRPGVDNVIHRIEMNERSRDTDDGSDSKGIESQSLTQGPKVHILNSPNLTASSGRDNDEINFPNHSHVSLQVPGPSDGEAQQQQEELNPEQQQHENGQGQNQSSASHPTQGANRDPETRGRPIYSILL